MCFSANASFGASIVIGIVGVIAVKKAVSMPQRLFAAIPLLFSVQQFSEGFVWLSLLHADNAVWMQPAMHIYLFFAYVVWPTWVPLTIMLLEKNKKQKNILRVLFITGAFISLFIAWCVLFFPVHAAVKDYHIQYTFDFPQTIHDLRWLTDAFYFIATLIAPFIATTKKVWLFGIVLIAAYLVSRIFFKDAVISVWCYLAAVLSIVVLFIIHNQKKAQSSFVMAA